MYTKEKRQIEAKRKFFIGKIFMYLDNTRQQFHYPFEIGEQHKIKIKRDDLSDPEFLKMFRSYIGEYNGFLFVFEYPENEFWMIYKD